MNFVLATKRMRDHTISVVLDVTFHVGNKHPNLTIIMGLRKKLYKQKGKIYNYDLKHMKIPINFSVLGLLNSCCFCFGRSTSFK